MPSISASASLHSVRLFIAVNVPAELKEKIAQTFYTQLPVKKLKRIQPENIHLISKDINLETFMMSFDSYQRTICFCIFVL